MNTFTKAVIAGSFDPVTNGHLWVIEQASKMFSEVDVVIAVNPAKKGMFTLQERLDLLNRSLFIAGVEKCTVSVLREKETVAKYAEYVHASVIVRGMRNTTDFEYERQLNFVNTKIAPGVQTIYLMPPRELIEVSSSFVKGLVGLHGWKSVVESYVPSPVFDKLCIKHATV